MGIDPVLVYIWVGGGVYVHASPKHFEFHRSKSAQGKKRPNYTRPLFSSILVY